MKCGRLYQKIRLDFSTWLDFFWFIIALDSSRHVDT